MNEDKCVGVSSPRRRGTFHALESTHQWRDSPLMSKRSWDALGKLRFRGGIREEMIQICAWQNTIIETKFGESQQETVLQKNHSRLIFFSLL